MSRRSLNDLDKNAYKSDSLRRILRETVCCSISRKSQFTLKTMMVREKKKRGTSDGKPIVRKREILYRIVIVRKETKRETDGDRGYNTEKRPQTSLRPLCSDGIYDTYATPNAISLIAKDNAVGAHPCS